MSSSPNPSHTAVALALIFMVITAVMMIQSTLNQYSYSLEKEVEKAIERYGKAVVYVSRFGLNNCSGIDIGDLCIEKHEIRSLADLRKLNGMVFAYYRNGEVVKPMLAVQSIQRVEKHEPNYPSLLLGVDAKWLTGLKPLPPVNASIAIIDTGVNYLDTRLNIVALVSTIPGITIEASTIAEAIEVDNQCRRVYGVPCFMDEHGHGTFVSSIIGAKTVGVMPGAKLVVVKAFVGYYTDIDRILLALRWIYHNAEKYNITVVNGSWGVPGATTGLDPVSLAIDKLYEDKKVITVVASGNYGTSPHSVTIPCGARHAICVGAFDPLKWRVASFSSTGTALNGLIRPDICAPGVNVVSILENGDYGVGSGTSFSTPIVTAVISRILEKHGYSISRQEVETELARMVIYKVTREKDSICGWGSI